MFEAFAHFHAMKQSLQEAYVHPADVRAPPLLAFILVMDLCMCSKALILVFLRMVVQEGYIGADQNWEYLNRFIQPVRTCHAEMLCLLLLAAGFAAAPRVVFA